MERLEIEAVIDTWSQRTEPVEYPVVISWHGCEAGGKTAVQAFRVFEKHMRGHFPERELVIRLKTGDVFAFAGIWEHWQDKTNPDAEPVLSCSVITTTPNSLMEPIHDRMPVILSPDLYSDWMNPANQDTGELKEYLLPYDPKLMEAYPVSTLVNSVRNQGPELIDEVAA